MTPKQTEALQAVADGRVTYGNVYPVMARRAAERHQSYGSAISFMVDGVETYGASKQTLPSLEEKGLIRTRYEDVPQKRVPARERRRHSVAGGGEVYMVQEHDEPADPGWRATVELTDAGRKALL